MAEMSPAQQQYPNLNPYATTNGNGSMGSTKDGIVNSAQSTMDSVKNSQTLQSLSSGPIADKARTETQTTQSEFGNLASSRTTPSAQTVTGQPLTHYHSFFYNLLSWENPRATAISYASVVLLIFAWRYAPIVRYALKALYVVLGITAAAEIVGKMVMGEGLATKMRPKRYYTLPRETLESIMEDLTELVNFFVIEFQRIVFAENVWATVGAFTTSVITYFLIKITPPWGLALLFATVAYFTPLVYIKNRELIDGHLSNAHEILNKQTAQVRDLASQHTNKAMEMSQNAMKEYGARASEMVGAGKKAAVDKGMVSEETATKVPGGQVKKEDFPSAPKAEPETTSAPAPAMHDGGGEEKPAGEQEPMLA